MFNSLFEQIAAHDSLDTAATQIRRDQTPLFGEKEIRLGALNNPTFCIEHDSLILSGQLSAGQNLIQTIEMLNPAKYRMSNEVMGETLDYGCLLQARQVIRQRVKAHHHIRSCIRWAITSSATAAGDNYFDDTLIMSRCPIQQPLNPAFQGRPKPCP